VRARGRDPARRLRSLGSTPSAARTGATGAPFEARAPPHAGVLDVTLDEWRHGRLVGTVDEVREQAARWAELGVETLILGVGALPFQVGSQADVDLLAQALVGSPGDGAAAPPTRPG